jgi:cytochrome c-type biogenesis protein CcmH
MLVCLLAVVMLGANSSTDPQARFGRIGHNMMCVCSCGQVLLECNHVGCPDSERMIGELRDQVSGGGGSADATILNWFVEKYGATVLAAPIRGGFDNLAWIMPITIFILAIFGTAFMVRMWAQRRQAIPVGIPPIRTNDAMRDRIRRETEWR